MDEPFIEGKHKAKKERAVEDRNPLSSSEKIEGIKRVYCYKGVVGG